MSHHPHHSTALRVMLGSTILATLAGAAEETWISGTVFEDHDGNGVLEPGDRGVPGVAVSNQIDVVATDAAGNYRLPLRPGLAIMISKPPGYALPTGPDGIPRFYRLNRPEGSCPGLRFGGIPPTGPMPARLDFPLRPTPEDGPVRAIITGDPQMRTAADVGHFRADIAASVAAERPDFYLALGDIANDDLGIYPDYLRTMAATGVPLYHVAGNHDIDYEAIDDSGANETYQRFFGPTWYSFTYGKTHVVVLDDVTYDGWDAARTSGGRYVGGIPDIQLHWLAGDLALVPPDHLVVVATHMPLFSHLYPNDPGRCVQDRSALFRILAGRRHLLALSGHLHVVERFSFAAAQGWTSDTPFPSINPGAACGAWWSGPKDDRGVPVSLCMDGSPAGCSAFTFTGNRFTHRFIPSRQPEGRQIRIAVPAGRSVSANVFAADPEAEVTLHVDGRPPIPMQRTVQPDPFMAGYMDRSRETLPKWMKGSDRCAHLWQAPLPVDLAPGSHALRVVAIDPDGTRRSAADIIIVGD